MREDKLGRLEGMYRSAVVMQSRQEKSDGVYLDFDSGLPPSPQHQTLLSHLELLHRIKTDLDVDVSLISMQHIEPESASKTPQLFQPKLAQSPERGSRDGRNDLHGDNRGLELKYSSVSAGDGVSRKSRSPPPIFEKKEPLPAHSHGLSAGQSKQPSALFASRLGSGGGCPVNGADIKDYSNSLRSSLNAYDLHAE